MHVTLDTADARPIYQQIMDEVRRAVVVGTLLPGDPLPSVRQLAADLRINPNTVAQAYRELERAGAVHVRRGQGTFVSEPTDDGAERRALARAVAERALRDAHRHGMDAAALVAAVRALAAESSESTESSASPPSTEQSESTEATPQAPSLESPESAGSITATAQETP